MEEIASCHYCGVEPGLTRDHIVPRSRLKFPADERNLVPACQGCNQRKADSWPTCACSRCSDAMALFGEFGDWPAAARRGFTIAALADPDVVIHLRLLFDEQASA